MYGMWYEWMDNGSLLNVFGVLDMWIKIENFRKV